MKIWIISKYASSLEVGFESRLFALARRFVKSGNFVAIISSDSNHFGNYPAYKNTYNFEKFEKLNVLRICTFKYLKTASIQRILSWIDFEIKLFFAPLKSFEKPDIIVVSSLSLITILNGIRLKYKYGAKLIFEIRDIWPLTIIEEGGYKPWNPFVLLLSAIEKYGYIKSDLIVGTMPNLNNHINSILGLNNKKCVCVPFGFDSNFFLSSIVEPGKFQSDQNLPIGKFIIGYAGSIGISNGLQAFIDCAKKMVNDERFIFTLLGDGDSKSNFMRQTRGYSNIYFIPKVNREKVASYLAMCNVLYFSSLNNPIWDFGWSPNKLIDYMMSGKPVLASYSGHQSMINEAKSGFFIPAEDSEAIKTALENMIAMNPDDLVKMGNDGKDWIVKNRDWDIVSGKYLEIMNELIND
jgi:glycosyltransferase involved in cell wall biosynthesis